VGDSGHDFTTAYSGQVGEKRRRDLPGDISEGIAIEKQERGAAMTLPQEFYDFR
jgi:hypothetical protein